MGHEDRPLALHQETVLPQWIDYNGHMNLAYYVLIFDHATDALFDAVGIGEAYRQDRNHSLFVVESHVTYDREVEAGDQLRVTTQILDCDSKRLHFFHRMYHATEGYLAATTELLSVHVDMSTRRTAPFPETVQAALDALKLQHEGLSTPEQAGRTIGIRKK